MWLEITENDAVHDRDASGQTMRQLHELGVRLVIDDFGTGASSLVSLKQFPLDAIKIASTFVADLGRDRDSDAICSAIIELAHSLGLCTIAEGVETLEQYAALRALDCELGQGHLFGPARPAADYGAMPAAMLGVVGRPTAPPRRADPCRTRREASWPDATGSTRRAPADAGPARLRSIPVLVVLALAAVLHRATPALAAVRPRSLAVAPSAHRDLRLGRWRGRTAVAGSSAATLDRAARRRRPRSRRSAWR